MQRKILAPGDQVEARCTKCRRNTNHTIVVIMDEVPFRVQCNICERQHNYRLPVEPGAKKKAAPQKSPARNTESKKWEAQCESLQDKPVKKYSIDGEYKVGDLISHQSFGLGVVQRLAGSQKVEILFESGLKIMRCR